MKITQISIIGDGSWGTTLAVYLAKKKYAVELWGPFPEMINKVKKSRLNDQFLPGIRIPANVTMTTDMGEATNKADLIILATPSQYLEGALLKIKKWPLKGKWVLSVIKGIDPHSLLRTSEIIEKHLGKIPLAVLSGPTIAMEVAKSIPTTAVIAASKRPLAEQLQRVLHSDSFRIYRHTDVVGVELGGSLKNIIAIACGVCDGLGFGTNAKAAILTRGLAEIARLGVAMGAKEKTFFGLSGLGDLVTTCVSSQSRNRHVGEQLGKGKSIDQILSRMAMVAEGVVTSKAAVRLSRKYRISMPITEEVYKIIYHKKNPKQAVFDLMSRELKSE